MEALSVAHSSAVRPETDPATATETPPERVGQRAAALFAVWAAVAGLSHQAGAVLLPAGAGTALAAGAALTLGLLLGLGHLRVAGRPGGSTVVLAQSLIGLGWSALYAWLAGGSAGGPVLGVGMYLSAIALAMPATSLRVLEKLMLAAALASALIPVLRQFALQGQEPGLSSGRLLEGLLASLVLVVLLGTSYLAARMLATARDQLQARNAELQAGIERIARRAERDHLTNSYNRQSILEMVGRERARADRSGEMMCVCLLDIDHFKHMNDRFGHLTGDRILAAFSRRVRGALRTMDTLNSGGLPAVVKAGGGDGMESRRAFGRVGGEEFIVLLPETSLRGALRCAERVRKAVVRRPFDGLHHVTVSIGIAEYRPGESVSSLIGRADQALYGAKNSGRNRVHCATTDGGPSAIVMPDIPAVS